MLQTQSCNDNYPRVTEILQAVKITDLSGVPAEVLERACQFGSAVHKTCELHDLNILDESTLDPALKPYLNQWIQFKKDNNITEFYAIEKHLINQNLGYQGTTDRILSHNDQFIVIDIKTSKSIHKSTKWQTAAYWLAFHSEIPFESQVNNRWIVQLKEDSYKLVKYTDYQDITDWITIVDWYKFITANKLKIKQIEGVTENADV